MRSSSKRKNFAAIAKFSQRQRNVGVVEILLHSRILLCSEIDVRLSPHIRQNSVQ